MTYNYKAKIFKKPL